MAVDRGGVFRDTATFVGPSADGGDNGYGIAVPGSSTDVTLKTGVKIGLFPKSLEADTIKTIGGGPVDLRDWEIVCGTALAMAKGTAFVVPGGDNPGTYRVKQFFRGPKGSGVIICTCNKEK